MFKTWRENDKKTAMKTDSVNHYKLLTITAISGSYNLTFFELLQLSKLEEKMIKKIIETKVKNRMLTRG